MRRLEVPGKRYLEHRHFIVYSCLSYLLNQLHICALPIMWIFDRDAHSEHKWREENEVF